MTIVSRDQTRFDKTFVKCQMKTLAKKIKFKN